jgi:replicative DNA helicase
VSDSDHPLDWVPGFGDQQPQGQVVPFPPAQEEPDDTISPLLVDGGSFIFDAPATPPAVWGDGQEVAWASGEALMLNGPSGVGKTTLATQLVAGRIGLRKDVLGMPVAPGERRVLYLAMDRPPQVARAMRRLFAEGDREVLSERLKVWKGPPPFDMARHPGLLLAMCQRADADTVIVDSLKDAIRKPSEDESGSGYNTARQRVLREGIEVIELHHQRKASGDNKKPSKLDDVYGSTWLTAGAGSVILLWGDAGDPVVELTHLKQPAEQIGPWQVTHDHAAGTSEVTHQADLLTLARHQGRVGLTAKVAAEAMFQTDKPTAAEVEKARRKLNQLTVDGHLYRREGERGGGTDRAAAAWFLIVKEAS